MYSQRENFINYCIIPLIADTSAIEEVQTTCFPDQVVKMPVTQIIEMSVEAYAVLGEAERKKSGYSCTLIDPNFEADSIGTPNSGSYSKITILCLGSLSDNKEYSCK